MCVVFAETEIIGLLASGTQREDIIAGVQGAIAARISALAGRNIDKPVVFTGGVALVSGMDTALQSALGQGVTISPDPQMTGALGAAILASNQITHY
jgi:activator of 2-hydroxyglutaryl-CoA dehydratase